METESPMPFGVESSPDHSSLDRIPTYFGSPMPFGVESSPDGVWVDMDRYRAIQSPMPFGVESSPDEEL